MMKISLIIQYTILFSLRSLTIEAAISSSTTSGIRGSSSTAVYDSVASAADSHRELELYNSSSSNNDEDRHRFLQVATDVSSARWRACGHIDIVLMIHECNSLSLISLQTSLSTLLYLLSPHTLCLYSQHHRIGHCTAEYQTNVHH